VSVIRCEWVHGGRWDVFMGVDLNADLVFDVRCRCRGDVAGLSCSPHAHPGGITIAMVCGLWGLW